MKTQFVGAVHEVEAEEGEHLSWAADSKAELVLLQAQSRALTAVGAKAEELAEKVPRLAVLTRDGRRPGRPRTLPPPWWPAAGFFLGGSAVEGI